MGTANLASKSIDIWTTAIKTTQGRGSSKKCELYGIKKLRELILELAVRGKLVPQDPNDEPASVMLERIAAEKTQLVNLGVIKKPKKLGSIIDAELPFISPTGWKWVRLQDVTTYIQRGIGPQYEEQGLVRVVSQKCVQWSGFDLKVSRYVANDSLVKYQDERFLRTRDLLWNSTGTGTVGRIVELADIPTKALVADSHVTVIRPFDVLGGFLKAYIAAPGIQSRIEPGHENALVSGTTNQVELNTSAVEALEIPIPPKAEQHRIVAKIDELMALCDQIEQQTEASINSHQLLVDTLLDSLTKAKDTVEFSENWTRLSNHFDTLITTNYAVEQLKKTILQLAVMGKLVPKNPNDEPASSSFLEFYAYKKKLANERIIKFKKRDKNIEFDTSIFPKHWELFKWNDISHWITYGFTRPMPHFDCGIPIATGKNVNHSIIDLDNAHFTDEESFNKLSDKDRPKDGDILITKDGSIGRTAIVDGHGKFCINQSVAVVWLKKMPASRRYLKLVIDAPISQERIEAHSKGQAIKHLSITDFGNMICPMPPINEQNRIIAKVDELMSLCDQLKSSLNEAQTTQLHLADTIIHELIGETVKHVEGAEANTKTMNITTILSLNNEVFDGSAVIAPIIRELGGSADAKIVWSKTKMSLPDFYAQLKIEIDAQYIHKPARADF